MIGIDLFSGCGGLTVGLKNAGIDVIAAVDIDPLAAETYRANHPEVHFIEKNIKNVSGTDLIRGLGVKVGELDVLAGCPPCQGFSTLRTRNSGKAVHDVRNNLINQFLRIVEEIKPKTVMLENVPGLETDYRFLRFVNRLAELEYKSSRGVLDVSKYGVPQRRCRLIRLAALDETPSLAKPSRGRVKTVKSAIAGLKPPEKVPRH